MSVELNFLDETLGLVGRELESRFGQNNNVREKNDASLVTDADLAAEKIILDRINRFYPNDAIISEESGYHRVDRTPGSFVWIVDPLDGTTNFANSYPFFCSSIARCQFNEDGKIESQLAGIIDPCHNKTYLAEKGCGAFCNGFKMKVHDSRSLNSSFLVTGFYCSNDADRELEIKRFYRIATSCQSIRRDGASALDLALVAAGVYDGFWEHELNIWDIAAGCLLVQEAGGTLSNYPKVKSASSLTAQKKEVSFDMEASGLIAGSADVAEAIYQLLKS